ncbi:hypothetical protein [uncultured Clostridium sp.]|uniref:hypothetical protein n=1 Tax=uncultured Clostridium sp. TaxID=59620 RepID=UPI0026124889|nr:hypothetical protein [uncultured Clostridium sp.]
MKKLKEILKRLSNTGTIIAIAGAIILILNNVGIIVDNTKAMYTINALCGIGVALGVLNNPTTKGLSK